MAILNRFPRFYFTAIRVVFCFSLRNFWRFQAFNPGNRVIRDSRFCAAKVMTLPRRNAVESYANVCTGFQKSSALMHLYYLKHSSESIAYEIWSVFSFSENWYLSLQDQHIRGQTLPLMHETKYRQFCANLARNLRQICATAPSQENPSEISGPKIPKFRGWNLANPSTTIPYPTFCLPLINPGNCNAPKLCRRKSLCCSSAVGSHKSSITARVSGRPGFYCQQIRWLFASWEPCATKTLRSWVP